MKSNYQNSKHFLNGRTTKSVTISLVMFERILFITLVAFVMAGCVHNKHASIGSPSQITTSIKPDCSSITYKWSYGLREYTVLRVRVMGVVDSALFNVRTGVARARDMADTAIRELDSMDQQVDTWKASAGECFGGGEYGKQVADKYLWVKKNIVEQKKVVEEILAKVIARNKALERVASP